MIYKIKRYLKKIVNTFFFIKDYFFFKDKADERFRLRVADWYPCLTEKNQLQSFDAHYLYHPAWAARIIAKVKPETHIDIASILNFSTIVSAFIPVEYYDYRPANLKLSNLSSGHCDLTGLNFHSNSIQSLSCMHTIEHVGLGRYGDKLDPSGDLKAMAELKRVVKNGGDLLFVVPVGRVAKIQFNAHRVYTYEQIVKIFEGFDLLDFSLVTDSGEFINNATIKDADSQVFGCGCFWFRKI